TRATSATPSPRATPDPDRGGMGMTDGGTGRLPVAVLGAGSWGTALAALIARHGHPTTLWGRDADVIAAIDGRKENPRYLPGIALPERLRATTDLDASMAGVGLVLVVRLRTRSPTPCARWRR